MPVLWDTYRAELLKQNEISQKERSMSVNKTEQCWLSEENFDTRHGVSVLGICQAGFVLLWYILTTFPFIPLGMVMYNLGH